MKNQLDQMAGKIDELLRAPGAAGANCAR